MKQRNSRGNRHTVHDERRKLIGQPVKNPDSFFVAVALSISLIAE